MSPSQNRLRERRIYEGEWFFCCQTQGCSGLVVEHCLNEHESHADTFLGNDGFHALERCRCCAGYLEWAGYSGDSPISNGLIRLLDGNHFMAATVILSAIVENSIQNLLWACLSDSGVDMSRANHIADGRLPRPSMIELIKALSDLPIRDIQFPSRNLVAHGRGFLREEEAYRVDLINHLQRIREWIEAITKDRELSRFMPTECDRWMLFMDHWSRWLTNDLVCRLRKL
jgi:hypothetical protein